MVDLAAIFDDVFGFDNQEQRVSEKGCARCDGVPEVDKALESKDTLGTPDQNAGHTSNQGVPEKNKGCARDIIEKQEVKGEGTPSHRAHPNSDNPLQTVDPDSYEERAGIIEFDAGLPRQEAETLAAQELGFIDADDLHGEIVRRWAAEIEQLAKQRAVSPDGAAALKWAQVFISQGWALQAVRLGWDEVELFGVCPRAPWQRLDRKGVAFGGAVVAVTAEEVAYVGGLRRFKAQVNNDGGAVPIWELTGVES